jgi:hypothetical protein
LKKDTRNATDNDVGVTPRNLTGKYRSFGGASCIRLGGIVHLISPAMFAAISMDIWHPHIKYHDIIKLGQS